jgi:hypothetical protein
MDGTDAAVTSATAFAIGACVTAFCPDGGHFDRGTSEIGIATSSSPRTARADLKVDNVARRQWKIGDFTIFAAAATRTGVTCIGCLAAAAGADRLDCVAGGVPIGGDDPGRPGEDQDLRQEVIASALRTGIVSPTRSTRDGRR